MIINIEIERLVLDGFNLTRYEQRQLQASLESELGQLLAADGLATDLIASGDIPHLQAGKFQYQRGQDAQALGRQIAQAVYEGIGQ